MVLQRWWASLVYNFTVSIPRGPPRTKQASSYENPTSSSTPDDDGSGSPSVLPGSASHECEACQCCVCLSGLKDGDNVHVLPCTHRFHQPCIDQWFSGSRRRTCPICRFKLDGGGGEAGSCRWEELTEEMVTWFSSFHVAGF